VSAAHPVTAIPVTAITDFAERAGTAPARRIFDDMATESSERLRSIRDELLRLETKDYWEVIDRGTNFDYVDAARKEKLKVFFGWFPSLSSERSLTNASS